MGALDNLKFATVKRSATLSPVVARRNKLLKKLFEQEAIAQAVLNGTPYAATKLKTVKDLDGNSRVVEVNKRVRNWSYTGDDGKLYLVVRYGNKMIEFAKGKQAIEVGDTAGLLKTLSIIKTAVSEGELDTQISNLVGVVREGFAK